MFTDKETGHHLLPLPAVVVIGRNEGQRLQTCLTSILASCRAAVVIYVDSGSTDGSVVMALDLGCEVVNLDMTLPFTAARARNEGFVRALQCVPDASHIQFVDGDCELVVGWLATAMDFLQTNPDVGAVCGRLRERFPERSVYNKICDLEWQAPPGKALSCGGNAIYATSAFMAMGGFRSGLIAGEEPELCLRLRAGGWRIWRLENEMAFHDAAILRFGQWWSRSKRTGYAFAEGAALHGKTPERHYVKQTRSAFMWGVILPLGIIGAMTIYPPALLGFTFYPLQMIRIAMKGQVSNFSTWQRAFFLMLGKFPEALGASKYFYNRWRGQAGEIIEYK